MSCSCLWKRPWFNFPSLYVCPEPVLANVRFFWLKWRKKEVSAPGRQRQIRSIVTLALHTRAVILSCGNAKPPVCFHLSLRLSRACLGKLTDFHSKSKYNAVYGKRSESIHPHLAGQQRHSEHDFAGPEPNASPQRAPPPLLFSQEPPQQEYRQHHRSSRTSARPQQRQQCPVPSGALDP